MIRHGKPVEMDPKPAITETPTPNQPDTLGWIIEKTAAVFAVTAAAAMLGAIAIYAYVLQDVPDTLEIQPHAVKAPAPPEYSIPPDSTPEGFPVDVDLKVYKRDREALAYVLKQDIEGHGGIVRQMDWEDNNPEQLRALVREGYLEQMAPLLQPSTDLLEYRDWHAAAERRIHFTGNTGPVRVLDIRFTTLRTHVNWFNRWAITYMWITSGLIVAAILSFAVLLHARRGGIRYALTRL